MTIDTSWYDSIRGYEAALKFRHTIVDMDLNAGLGEVVQREETILSDTLSPGHLQAVSLRMEETGGS